MPIWLRKFTFNQIKEFYDSENKRYESQTSSKPPQITRPDIDPTYKSSVSKK